MTKDEALRMAIETLSWFDDRKYVFEAIQACKEALEPTVAELNDEYLRDTHVEGLNKPRIALEKATKAWYDIDLTGQTNLECARNWFIEGYVQALEFPPKEPYNLVEILNDPMKAYPHNFSTPAKGNALLFGLCQEAADEIERLKAETQEPTKEEILGKVFDAVYAQYQPKAETQEPVEGNKMIKSYEDSFSDVHLKPPSREWVGLSDAEIWDIANFLGKNKEWDYPVMFAKTIEKVLREKNA